MTTFDPEKITYFAKTDARGQEVSFGIKAKDRQRHMYVVGKTGMGKSTLLENMAAQDIQNGEGMAFIDPHGSAAETLLEYVPEHRVKDVVYFAPFDIENPISFNVMEDVGPDKRHLVVSGLMSTFKKIWVDAWSARMEYILTNALLVLIEYPETTLLSVNRLFSDKAYRKKVVEACQDPAVKSFWVDEFANYTERFTADALPAIQNKVGQFTGNPLIRNIIGQPHSSFDIRELMDNKKILIMNLSKGLIGETNANLLGSMLTTRIYLAAMSRADLPVEKMRQMPNFYFYVDEFQSFANATFANILSEARKYHLNLIIAHQYIAQMEEEVRDAVFGNVGTTVAFRVGPFDGEVLETVFSPRFLATDLVNLGFAQIYLTLMIDGIGSQPFSAQTLPPVQLPSRSCKGMVIESSRKHYASKREDVEEMVVKLHSPEKTEYQKKSDDRKTQWQSNGPKNDSGNARSQSNSPANSPSSPSDKPTNSRQTNQDTRGNQSNQSNQGSRENQTNQNNKNTQSGERNGRRPESQKSHHTHKSPDELRAILSKMTNTDNSKKNNSVSVETKSTEPAPKKTEESSQSKPFGTHNQSNKNNQSDQKNQSDQNNQSGQNRPNHQPKKPDSPKSDLRSALADVLKQVDAQNTAKEATTPPEPDRPPTPPEPAPKKTDTPATPPAEPKAVASPTPETPKNTLFAVRRQLNTQSEQPAAQVVGSVVRSHQQNKTNAGASAVRNEASTPAQPAQAPITKSSAVSLEHNQLDVQVIKKMLKHNDQERSPFV